MDPTYSLSEQEARVLGVLIEKDLSTPEYYPMTMNALITACNQKTNRNPVVRYEEHEVAEAIESLQRKRLVGSSTSSHGRAIRYRHALVEVLELPAPHLAILASLLLRGPETPGELRGRAARMHAFGSLGEVDAALSELMDREPALVRALPRRPGRKEVRYTQLLAESQTVERDEDFAASGESAELLERLSALEERVEDLAEAFSAFRKQFE